MHLQSNAVLLSNNAQFLEFNLKSRIVFQFRKHTCKFEGSFLSDVSTDVESCCLRLLVLSTQLEIFSFAENRWPESFKWFQAGLSKL